MSPGHLPDVLDTEKIRFGLSNRRNPTLTSHAVHILPYRGLGTGIPRYRCLANDPAGGRPAE
ncbi:hypothetical protein [Pseudomonas capsici]|uniref:hypothetical protein n=1 Tax=Pseudomonas capsici TaxID=2810614 RepID=UPI0021F23023|nr:hypothetical protein [Pseudomonas capsici]MCV4265285.1 hypothetical protein [Pseudomonas capsici]